MNASRNIRAVVRSNRFTKVCYIDYNDVTGTPDVRMIVDGYQYFWLSDTLPELCSDAYSGELRIT